MTEYNCYDVEREINLCPACKVRALEDVIKGLEAEIMASRFPVELFDGHGVLGEIHPRFDGVILNGHVAEVLSAVCRLIRKRIENEKEKSK